MVAKMFGYILVFNYEHFHKIIGCLFIKRKFLMDAKNLKNQKIIKLYENVKEGSNPE